MINVVYIILLAILGLLAFWLLDLFIKSAVILFLIAVIMACLKVGTLLSYTIMVFAAILIYAMTYYMMWGDD
ncbi:MAG: hypothetical protein WCP01_17020 [Methylococcaceae bacterium]|jgi:hypothetical protein